MWMVMKLKNNYYVTGMSPLGGIPVFLRINQIGDALGDE